MHIYTGRNHAGRRSIWPDASAAPAFSPTDIATIKLWLDGADTTSITASGSSVSQWNDKSGNAYHFTQATGARQPDTGVTTLNGKNALKFNGGQALVRATTELINTGVGYSLFMVHRTLLISEFDTVLTLNSNVAGTTGNPYMQWDTRVGLADLFFGDSVSGAGRWKAVRAQFGPSNNTFVLTNHTYTGTGVQTTANYGMYANGVAQTVLNCGFDVGSTNAGSVIGSYDPAGGVFGLEGDIAEVILYAADLSAGDRTSVTSYLTTKWGL